MTDYLEAHRHRLSSLMINCLEEFARTSVDTIVSGAILLISPSRPSFLEALKDYGINVNTKTAPRSKNIPFSKTPISAIARFVSNGQMSQVSKIHYCPPRTRNRRSDDE